jgi:hypothetical protein
MYHGLQVTRSNIKDTAVKRNGETKSPLDSPKPGIYYPRTWTQSCYVFCSNMR